MRHNTDQIISCIVFETIKIRDLFSLGPLSIGTVISIPGVQSASAHCPKARPGTARAPAPPATRGTPRRASPPLTTTAASVAARSAHPLDSKLILSNTPLQASVPSPAICAQLFLPAQRGYNAIYQNTRRRPGRMTADAAG